DRRLAVSPWDRLRVWQENFSRGSQPPFTAQLNDVPRARFYMEKLKQLSLEINDNTRERARSMYKEAIAWSPDDPALHQNFSQFLTQIGDRDDAVKEEQRFGELLPQTPLAPFKVGTLLVRGGDIGEAEKKFSRALTISENYTPALSELGVISANRRETAEA